MRNANHKSNSKPAEAKTLAEQAEGTCPYPHLWAALKKVEARAILLNKMLNHRDYPADYNHPVVVDQIRLLDMAIEEYRDAQKKEGTNSHA